MESNLPFFSLLSGKPYGLVHQSFHGDHTELVLLLVCHDQLQQFEGQTFQSLTLLKNIVGGFHSFFFRHRRGTKHICISDDGSQRCLQFMCKGSSKIFLLLCLALQFIYLFRDSICHMVKITGKFCNLISSLFYCPGIQFS